MKRQTAAEMSPTRRPHGFTLVEIVVTLAIVSIIIGMTALAASSINKEERVVEPAVHLKEFAKRARQAAILEQRPYQVQITPSAITLRSTARQQDPITVSPVRNRVQGERGGSVVDAYEFEEGTTCELKRWRDREWRVPVRDAWVFEQSGLCEPLLISFQNEDGIVRIEFNPLTADADMEETEMFR